MRLPSLLLVLAFAALLPAGAQEAPRLPPEGSEVGYNALIVIGEPAGEPLSGDALYYRTEEVASTIRCPQCQGLSIADSTARTAVAMKAELKDLLAAGYTEEQALTFFEKSYGEFIRLEPKAEGFNLVVWIAPVVGLMLGLALVVARVSSRQAPPGGPEPEATEADEGEPQPAADEDDELAAYREQVRREVSS